MKFSLRLPEPEFGNIMKGVLSPSQPIQTPELLQGREKQLEDIRRALYSDGRQVFIYGYRGVGKTSLAQTAAVQYQSSDRRPIFLGCTSNATFYQTIRDLYIEAFPKDPAIQKVIRSGSSGLKWGGLSAEAKASIESGKVPTLSSVNEAVALTEFVASVHSKQPAVVLDEFDLIKSPNEQALFASYVKQIADKRINLRFFFCGIAESIDEFFDSHESMYRYFQAVKLDRMDYSPRMEIVRRAAKQLSIQVEDYDVGRIARISDGFPHFIHLVCEKLFWTVYNDLGSDMRASPDHFEKAVALAVEDIHVHLRVPYEKATKKYTNDAEPILWAIADSHELSRRSSDIYGSYQQIMGQLMVEPMTRDKFNQRINNLKRPASGNIVIGSRTGWYEFREKMMRGYARLRSEQQGVQLEAEHPLQARRRSAFSSQG